MTTETTLSDDRVQAEHAALFRRVAEHLAVTAGQLTRTAGNTQLSPLDVARLFVATGTAVLLEELGDAVAVEFLREYAARIEADRPTRN